MSEWLCKPMTMGIARRSFNQASSFAACESTIGEESASLGGMGCVLRAGSLNETCGPLN